MGAQVDVGDVTGQCGGAPWPGDSCAEVWREPACFGHRQLCGERRSRAFVVTTVAAVAHEPVDTRDKGPWKTGIRGSAVLVGGVEGE